MAMRVPAAGTPLVNIPEAAGGGRPGIYLNAPAVQGASSAAPFGGAQAAQWGELGGRAEELARAAAQVGTVLQRENDETWARTAYTKLNEGLNGFLFGDGSPDSGLFNQKGAAALGSIERAREFFDRQVRELSRNMSSNAAEMFTLQAGQLKNSEQRRVAMFEAGERRQWQFDTYKAAAETARNRAVDNFTFSNLRREAMAEMTEAIGGMLAMNGAPPEQIALQTGQATEAVLLAGADNLIAQGDYAGAFAVLNEPGLSETGRRRLGQSWGEQGWRATMAEYQRTGNLPALRRSMAIAADFSPEGFSRFLDNLDLDLKEEAAAAAAREGLEPEVAWAVIKIESGGDRFALGKSGEVGPMQLKEDAAKDVGVDRRDPLQNVAGGVAYYARLYRKYGDLDLAAMAYNWGPGNTDAWLKTGKGANGEDLPEQVSQYLAKLHGLLGLDGDGALAPAAGPELAEMANAGDPELSAAWSGLSEGKQLEEFLRRMPAQARQAAQEELADAAGAQYGSDLAGQVADGKLSRADALEIIAGIRGQTVQAKALSQYNLQAGMRKAAAAARQEQDRAEFMRAYLDNSGNWNEQYRLLDQLPEDTPEAKIYKTQAAALFHNDLAAADPRLSGIRAGTNPAAYVDLYDKIMYGEILDQKDLYAQPGAYALNSKDIGELEQLLANSKQVAMSAAKEVFIRALGDKQGQPGKDGLADDAEKNRFAGFVRFAQAVTAANNRGQDQEFLYGLACLYLGEGEYGRSVLHFGYGVDMPLEEALQLPDGLEAFLPELTPEMEAGFAALPKDRQEYWLDQIDAEDPEDAREWAVRNWFKQQALGPRGRPAPAGARDIIPEMDLRKLQNLADSLPESLVTSIQDSLGDYSPDALYLYLYRSIMQQQAENLWK